MEEKIIKWTSFVIVFVVSFCLCWPQEVIDTAKDLNDCGLWLIKTWKEKYKKQ
jgi:hypothetical protein